MGKHFGFGASADQVVLHISECRWWWDALIHVADGICALSRHRWCNRIVGPVYELNERHIRHKLSIPVDREHWVQWARLTGAEDPSWWWEDDDIPAESA